jgi:hypothetical protein
MKMSTRYFPRMVEMFQGQVWAMVAQLQMFFKKIMNCTSKVNFVVCNYISVRPFKNIP